MFAGTPHVRYQKRRHSRRKKFDPNFVAKVELRGSMRPVVRTGVLADPRIQPCFRRRVALPNEQDLPPTHCAASDGQAPSRVRATAREEEVVDAC
jgi:hypothetical protein